MKLWAALAFALTPALIPAQLTEAERKGLEDTLFIGNLRMGDLNFARRPYEDRYRLGIVNLSIDKPIESIDRLLELHASSVDKGTSGLINQARKELFAEVTAVANPHTPAVAESKEIPPEILTAVAKLANDVSRANAAVRAAQSKLTPAELRTLLESLPQWATEEPSIKFDFVQQPMAPKDQILELLAKVDISQIVVAAEQLCARVEQEAVNLKRLAGASKWEGFVKFKVGDIVTVVAGVGDDTHRDRDARLVIDLGGNDRYFGRAGAGPGNAALSIDMGGDDHYKLPDVGAGCGILGIGLAYDLGGHDNFRGKSLAFGAGLAGVGLFYKDGGDDSYQTAALSQGFGMFGIGILNDTRGGDLYDCKFYGQGASRTMGWGHLVDEAGDDTYRAGSLILNAPLFTNVHYSNAQGFSSGYREDTGGLSGGVGLLTDADGDDAYIGETYCQAASYWYALGSLWDGKGHDTYRAYHYAQASAMHMCGAYLLESEGDDSYVDNFGAAHAIGHDYGVGVLVDRSGNDVYAGRDSRPGIGNANGLGLFLDVAGDDRYSGPNGTGNPARNSGSLGIFADLSGQDLYRTGLNDGEAAYREQWGIAYDLESKLVTNPPETNETSAPAPGSIPRGTDEELEKIYTRATQWNVGSAQADVRAATHQLIGIGLPALQWMIDKNLAKASRLEQQAFVVVARAIGPEGLELVAKQVAAENEEAALVAIMVSIDAVAAEAGQYLPVAIKKPKLQRMGARLAGVIGSTAVGEDLARLAESEDKLTALNATISLALTSDVRGMPVAQKLMKSSELPIRKAAIFLMSRFPDALGSGQVMIRDPEELTARVGIELLGTLGSPEALGSIGSVLRDPRPGVRITALLALNGRAPQEYKQTVLDLRRDSDERVRAVALRIDPGR